MAWIRNSDGSITCDRHDETFSPPTSCSKCPSDPGELPDAEPEAFTVDPPDGCQTTEQHERKFVELAELAEQRARTLARARGKSANPNALAKLLDVGAKLRRASSSLARDREDKAFVERLERRRRELSRGR